MTTTPERKVDHLELCATADVGFRHKTTLLEGVELLHDALPELRVDDIDTSTRLLGKGLRAPLVIAAMTGGTPQARSINRDLAQVAEARGLGFGLGSQRAMLEGRHRDSYSVRDVAPTCLLLGNLSGVQVRDIGSDRIAEALEQVSADALCVHLNPAMELIQPEGDRDFVGVAPALGELVSHLDIPVVAKETGCGLSSCALQRLIDVGVRHVDVSGAGGTSWVAVEALRAEGGARAVGQTLRDWGVPTAASVAYAAAVRPGLRTIIATGGVTSGLDVARALALGAHAAGLAGKVLRAYRQGGAAGVHELFDRVEAELRAVMLLVGARTIDDLRVAPRVIRGELESWLRAPPA